MIGMERKYFEWLTSHIATTTKRDLYSGVLEFLHRTVFVYVDPMDSNRAEDGIDLRYTFGDEMRIPTHIIESTIDDQPCSMLEMMVALAMRIEDHIMYDPEKGDRTSRWFWEMVRNLSLSTMCGNAYDEYRCELVMKMFNKRMYHRDGYGGLFSLKGSNIDFRELDIWKQAMLYLTNVVKEEDNA